MTTSCISVIRRSRCPQGITIDLLVIQTVHLMRFVYIRVHSRFYNFADIVKSNRTARKISSCTVTLCIAFFSPDRGDIVKPVASATGKLAPNFQPRQGRHILWCLCRPCRGWNILESYRWLTPPALMRRPCRGLRNTKSNRTVCKISNCAVTFFVSCLNFMGIFFRCDIWNKKNSFILWLSS